MIDYKAKMLEVEQDAECSPTKSYGGRIDFTIHSGKRRLSATCFSEFEAWMDAYERLSGVRPKLQVK